MNNPSSMPFRPSLIIAALISLAVFVGLGFNYLPQARRVADVTIYETIANKAASAVMPLESEYPPLVTALFEGVGRISGENSFATVWIWLMLAIISAASLYAFTFKRTGAYLLPVGLLATTLLLGPEVVFARYDLLVMVALFFAWQEASRNRHGWSAGWLALATGLKFVPIVLFPLLLILAPRSAWKKIIGGAAIGAVLSLAIPILTLGLEGTRSNLEYMAGYHAERGIQVESSWSSADLLLKTATGQQAKLEFDHGATHNKDLGQPIALASTIAVMLGLLAAYFMAWRSRRASLPERTAEWWSAALLWAIVAAPVFSPQYLVWVLPALFVWLISEAEQNHINGTKRWMLVIAVFAAALTTWIYPHNNDRLTSGDDIVSAVVLAVRNLSILTLALLSLREAVRKNDPATRPAAVPATNATTEPRAGGLLPAWFTRESAWLRSPAARRTIATGALLFMTAFVIGICTFKMLDRDFWWHITAGKIMVTEQRWIDLDPFAYAREGMEYISTHEWLAQVVLYLVHASGGITGIIVFRTILIAMAAAFVLAIDRKRLWPNVFIAAYAVNAARPGFMDRPQLFTFVLLAAFVWLACHILDDDRAGRGEHGSKREHLLWLFIPLEILWVNFHGGAALVGIGIVGALFMQRLSDWAFATTPQERSELGHGLRRALTISVLTALCFFATPTGWHNMSFLVTLLTDKTVEFISEWKPRAIGLYLADYAVVWLVGLSTIALARRKTVFTTIVFLAMGYLSLKAFRHEMLFAFAAAGLVIYQLKHAPRWQSWLDWTATRWAPLMLSTLVVFGTVTAVSAHRFQRFAARDHLYGHGAFDLAKGGADYLDRSGLTGRMFNTYGIGGYMIYRGYPDRKVYIDGRNVDYGLDYMGRTFVAQKDPEAWKSLDKKFGFSYAIIDYDAIREWNAYPFVDHLGQSEEWALTYVDDWTAVYVKRTPENAAIIARDELKSITPQLLTGGFPTPVASRPDSAQAIAELERIAQENPDGIKALTLLAKAALESGQAARAEAIVRNALAVQPLRATLRLELGKTLAAQERWEEAVREYRWADCLALDRFASADYETMRKAADEIDDYGALASFKSSETNAPQVLDRMPDFGPQDEDTKALAAKLLAELQGNQSAKIEKLLDDGIAAAGAGEQEKALEAFEGVLRIDPKNAAAYSNIGAVYLQQKKYAEAEAPLRRAIELDEKLPDGHYNLALALARLERFEEALTEAKRAHELGKDSSAMIAALEARLK